MKNSRLLREPLVHFLVLGLLIFAVDWYFRPPADNRRLITVDSNLENTLVALFRDGQGREPTGAEVDRLIKRWLLNEVYYREALMLGLDTGDEMIRSRLVLKMRDVVLNNLVLPDASDQDLRAWFDAHRARYDTPARFDVAQYLVADAPSGSREAAEKLLPAAGEGAPEIPEAYANAVRRYAGRTKANIASLFGEDFAAGLLAQPAGSWRVLRSKKGWHVARVESSLPAVAADFDAVKAAVKTDYQEAQRTVAVFKALKEIRGRYTILYEGEKILQELDETDSAKATQAEARP